MGRKHVNADKKSENKEDTVKQDAKAEGSKSASSSSFLGLISALVVVCAIGFAVLQPSSFDFMPQSSTHRDLKQESVNSTAIASKTTTSKVFKPKYESELVHIKTQKLLFPNAKCTSRTFQVIGDLVHVEQAMNKGNADLQAQNQVFLMLNGQNDGVFVPWQSAHDCLFELATFAAQHLGADIDLFPNGVKLMTQMGEPITTAAQLHANRIAHVLLDGQIWVWPGIKVGHVFQVEGCTVKTLSLRPKVFSVEHFFTEDEAESIMKQGIAHLARSPVDSPDAVDGYHADRTSDTAFLDDNAFTRDFRARTAALARLPSPSFVERLQLVRYQKGQFFRKHEDYFDSKQFLNRKQQANEDYREWTGWAAKRLDSLLEQGEIELPEQFTVGGAMYPDYDDKTTFQHALLQSFMEDADASNFFMEHADVEWGDWIRDNLKTGAHDIMTPLLSDKGYMLRHIIIAWEKRIGLPQLQYKIPKRALSAVTHYFRWIRWAKSRIQDLLDQDESQIPADFRPEGPHYPTYHTAYQTVLLGFVLDDYTRDQLVKEFGVEWTDWIVQHKYGKDTLLEALRGSDKIFDLVVESFTKRAGPSFTYKKPQHLHHFEPNRFVTVFLYLNECPDGGETVFPYSKERLVTNIQRDGMDECSEGLAVPPTKLMASMFYSQTPENDVDPASMHGGCPPAEGVKYGSNSFAWNADADEGANAWDLGEDLKKVS